MKTSTGKPTKAEQRRFQDLIEIGCVCCLSLGIFHVPEVHHQNLDGKAGQKRLGHLQTVPLCTYHHQNKPMYPFSLKWHRKKLGPSLAGESKAFRARFGTDEELLAKTNALIAERRAA